MKATMRAIVSSGSALHSSRGEVGLTAGNPGVDLSTGGMWEAVSVMVLMPNEKAQNEMKSAQS